MIAEREDSYRTCCSTFSQEWCCSFMRGRRKEDWTQVRSNLLVPIPLNQRGMPGARFPFKTPDLLKNGTEACGQTTCCSSLHFHTQISFLTFLHPFCPTSALSFHLTTRTVTNPAFLTAALLAHEVMPGKYTFCHLLSTVAASHPWCAGLRDANQALGLSVSRFLWKEWPYPSSHLLHLRCHRGELRLSQGRDLLFMEWKLREAHHQHKHESLVFGCSLKHK